MDFITSDLLTSMRKQLQLDKTAEAFDLLNCPMDGEAYNEILIRKKLFDPANI